MELPLTSSIHWAELWCTTRLGYYFRSGHTTGSFRMHWVYQRLSAECQHIVSPVGPMKIEHVLSFRVKSLSYFQIRIDYSLFAYSKRVHPGDCYWWWVFGLKSNYLRVSRKFCLLS
jgi:hypothetical protein